MRKAFIFTAAVLFWCACCAAANGDGDLDKPVPDGHARLYLLRPPFSEVSRTDNPLLTINGAEIMHLSYGTYTSLILKPGTYEVTTSPGPGEANFWKSGVTLSVEADKTYFLAIWNEIRVGASPAARGAKEAADRTAGVLGATAGVIGALISLATENSAESVGVRYEIVSKADVATILGDLSHVPSKTERIEP